MKLRAWVDDGWKEALLAEGAAVAPAISAGVHQASDGLKEDFRSQVRSAGLGAKLANAWQNKLYQPGEVTAAGFVFSKAASIISGYATGATILARGSAWLCIPTENVQQKAGAKRATPRIWSLRHGKLTFVHIHAGLAVLTAPPIKAGDKPRVMFILVKRVKVKKRLELEGPARVWEEALPAFIIDNWDANGVKGEG